MSTPTIDTATFKALQDTAGAAFVGELLNDYFDEAPQLLQALRDALASRAGEAFRRSAHSLKSSSNTFGALALGARARELELRDFEATLQQGAQALDALEAEYAKAAAALKELRDA